MRVYRKLVRSFERDNMLSNNNEWAQSKVPIAFGFQCTVNRNCWERLNYEWMRSRDRTATTTKHWTKRTSDSHGNLLCRKVPIANVSHVQCSPTWWAGPRYHFTYFWLLLAATRLIHCDQSAKILVFFLPQNKMSIMSSQADRFIENMKYLA